MDDATLRRRLWEGMLEAVRLTGRAAIGSVHEVDGALAAVVPDVPGSSLLNVVAPRDAAAPALPVAALDETYRAAGLAKWGVWIDPARGPGAEAAARDAGLVLDTVTTQMGVGLDELHLDDAPALAPLDLATVGMINDRAYGYDDRRFERLVGALPPDAGHALGIDADGGPASAVYAFDHDGNALVWLVATLPEARRRGLAGAAMRGALRAARDRGCTSTTLWSAGMARSLYAALGYRALGELHLWERRP
ncbi:MAG TPA: GNAT family N-acetyltransferase [Solirubrobacteraceae bacterium]|nr:GNAT family N-acetyltransferase [Solirubrobacteraceae bacterium]